MGVVAHLPNATLRMGRRITIHSAPLYCTLLEGGRMPRPACSRQPNQQDGVDHLCIF